MKCPKCEEGTIISIVMKMTGKEASLCDFCETLWEKGERISSESGSLLSVAKEGGVRDYTIEESEDKDQDHRSAAYSKFK